MIILLQQRCVLPASKNTPTTLKLRAGVFLALALLWIVFVLNLPPFTALHEHDRIGWDGWLNSVLHGVPLGVVIGAESRESYLTRTVRSYGVWSFANRTLPKDTRVLTWSGGDQFYSQRARVWALAATLRRIVWAETGRETEVLQGLYKQGITHLIVDRHFYDLPEEWDKYAILGPVSRASWYDVLYEDRYYTLYRVRWEELATQLAGVQQ